VTPLATPQLILAALAPILIGVFLFCGKLVVTRNRRIESLARLTADLRERLSQLTRDANESKELFERQRESAEALRRTIVYIPEIAQRLAGNLEVRQIPGATLDLVDEILDPDYAVFYRASRNEVVAVECRGDCEYAVGHRIQIGSGLVGWTAERQMAFTEEDAERESGLVRSQHLSQCYPAAGFSICIPLVVRDTTIGVILVGPLRRTQPQLRELTRTIALIASVSIESASMFKKQQTLAKFDGLTGILNKTNILGRANAFTASTGGVRAQDTLSVFMMDIDYFKKFNDTKGHLCGDELLKDMSKLLDDHLRDGECIGRFGGEEFLLLMPGTSKNDALQAADRFRALIEECEFSGGQGQPAARITISGGVATWPIDGEDIETVLSRADEALYIAKRSGRNRVTAYVPPMLGSNSDADFSYSDDAPVDEAPKIQTELDD
jgi:diguanylate cyclase (GGDEF)-like protein